jgi:3-hydroxymyristoyl/3-hydroxydecanoyl-(acyl carrier protein) dehydratase
MLSPLFARWLIFAVSNGNSQSNEVELEGMVTGDHPALVGHFPGEPLVPGVVLLECVAAAADREFGARRLIAIPSVKFLAPLRPGELFRISLSRREETSIAFECRQGSTILARGRLIRTG